MRVLVIGPGALGLLMAVRLADAGAEVGLLDYRPGRAGRLAKSGVRLEHGEGELHLPLKASAHPPDLAHCDLAIVCVKAYHTAAVAEALGRHLAPGARALTLQNGAGNVETLVAALGQERVLGGITSEGATLVAEGHARHAGAGQSFIGPAAGEPDAFCLEVVELFNTAGFAAQAAAGVQNLIWTKLVINVGINALTAILDVNNGVLLELAGARRLMELAVDEALAVGRALGVEFLHADMPEAVRQVAQRTAANISSMRQDVRAARRTEIDFINGIVCQKAEELNLAAPINQALALLIKAREEGYLEQAGRGET